MKPLIGLLLLASSFVVGSAQEKVIDRSEFDSIVKDDKAQSQKWAGKSYRMTVSTLAQISGKPESDYSAKMIFEYGSNGSSRIIHSSTFGGKTNTTETLKIGKLVYTRIGTEAWTRKEGQTSPVPAQGSGNEADKAPFQVMSSETEYKYLGPGDYKGEKVEIYIRTERQKKVNSVTGKAMDSVITSKYWINGDGLILKNEIRSENHWTDQTSHNSIITEREPDPTMLFKEPDITPKP